MIKFTNRLIASLQVLLIAALPLMTARQAHAAGCASCTPYETAKAELAAYCAAHPSTNVDGTVVRGSRRGSAPTGAATAAPVATCEEKTAAFELQYGQLQQFCQAHDMLQDGEKAEKVTATVYTAATAVCLAACVMGNNPSKPAWELACLASGGVAGITDVVQAIRLGSLMDGLIGAGVMGFAGQAAYAGLSGTASTTSYTVGGKTFATSCVASGLLLVVAGLKWMGASSAGGKADENCSNAAALGASAPASQTGTISGGSGGGSYSASGGSNGSAYTKNAREVSEDFTADDFMQGAQSAATADPYGSILTQMPNLDQVPSGLDKLGIGLNDINKGLDSQGPGSLLSGMPGIPGDTKAALAQFDAELAKAVNSGNFNVPGAIAKSGGGGGASKSAGGGAPGLDFSSLFGKKEDAAGGPAAELNFKASAGGRADGDIWHSNWKGSIFQIVSNRLDKSREKVDSLEWQSPLNRALSGLPSKTPQKK